MPTGWDAAHRIMEILEEAGHQAFLVGGSVRDRLRGAEPSDYDVATDAHPEQVMVLFPRTAPTGLSHGTVTVTAVGTPIEVTTFRREAGYSDHRRPDEVRFVSRLEEDLARRDFTINAMAEDRRGQIIDPFDGRKDLERGRIRAVGQPTERFTEDALRMVRAVRFAAQLGFAIDPMTESAISACRDRLQPLAVERVAAELDKMWTAPHPAYGAVLLWKHQLFRYLPPFCAWDGEGVANEPLHPLSGLDALSHSDVRWAFFLFACGVDEERMGRRLRSLRLPGRRVKRIAVIARIAAASSVPLEEEEAKRRMLDIGGEGYQQAISLLSALGRLEPETAKQLERQVATWWKEMPVQRREDLAVDGRVLADALELQPGPWLKPMLEFLLEQVALGQIPNNEQALIDLARSGRQ
ncbi:CCA tRNA nucleotidyltransferase [Desmospora profundinema]|uniref:tRNA nucleotidyltransferase (CCA-adding enzyme) n=1 Tax=Desmospora profundinema TaxID=1571184 RepID=A0ABU1II57_9BACL|nr:CCA tRNA nucleotidyltransferase [Desmospora profundinema]MDR6224460.1 tRNA nucleotidyltransferase (CCA-adding enzyme) [Desmospora profundinema]